MSRGWLLGLTGLVVWLGLQTQVLADSQGISLDSAERLEDASYDQTGVFTDAGNATTTYGNGTVTTSNSSFFADRDPEEQAQLARSFSHTDPVYLSEGLGQLKEKCQKDAESKAMSGPTTYIENDPQRDADAERQRLYQSTPMRSEPEDPLQETSILNINDEKNMTDILYQGDVILTTPQLDSVLEAAGLKEANDTTSRKRRQASRYPYYQTWTNNQVAYYFDPSASSTAINVFQAAAKFWSDNTCIKFTQSSTAQYRIRVFKGSGCYSYVGQIGGEQDLSLGTGCEYFGTAAHELGHALGFFHEQSRLDRDDHISLHLENLRADFVDQYNKETAATNDNFGLPYDYGSIMQYDMFAASVNNLPTMLALIADYSPTLGSHYVAFRDVKMMNQLYTCTCDPSTAVTCQNGGYPNPNACTTRCNCPGLYGGALCDERPNDGGASLTATPDWQWINVTIGDGTYTVKISPTELTYWITSESGTTIEFLVDYIYAYQIAGCKFGGAEFKVQQDQMATGYRVCMDPYYKNITLKSTTNFVPVRIFNSLYYTITNIRYRQVGTLSTTTTTTPAPVTTTATSTTSTPVTTTATSTTSAPVTTTATSTTTQGPTTTVNATGLVDQLSFCPDVIEYGHCRVRYIKKNCELSCISYASG